MDTGREQTETTKLLLEQKTLFCKLLLLEIEKYEQNVNKLNKSSSKNKVENINVMEEDTKYDGGNTTLSIDNPESQWQGFKELDDVESFGRQYYHGVLNAITNNEIFNISSTFPSTFLDENAQITVNGITTNGLREWIKYHNKGMNHVKECYLADFHIISWIPYSFAAKYTISLIFSNNQKCVNIGTVSMIMSKKHKKIITQISTSDHKAYSNMVLSMPRPK